MVMRNVVGFFGLVSFVIASACCPATDYATAWIMAEQKADEVFGDDAGTGEGGSGGARPECTPETVTMDCVGPPDAVCGSATCVDGKCALEIKVGSIASQKYGDCKVTRCNQLGELTIIDDAEDFFNDANQCTIDYCRTGLNGDLEHENLLLPDGVPCPEAGDGYCWQGKCVACIEWLPQATCNNPLKVCDQIYCEQIGLQCAGSCGGSCAPCASDLPCATAADCQSGVCKNNVCQAPTCFDGVQNDGETGIDCGASSCPLCPANQGCSAHEQCESQVCVLGICQPPTCLDGTQNGDEIGIDCGGAKCAPCPDSP